jgi:hypothetical protein
MREKAIRIVDEIIKDLTDRRGLKTEWHHIDEEVKNEIKDVWIKIILKEDAEPVPFTILEDE